MLALAVNSDRIRGATGVGWLLVAVGKIESFAGLSRLVFGCGLNLGVMNG